MIGLLKGSKAPLPAVPRNAMGLSEKQANSRLSSSTLISKTFCALKHRRRQTISLIFHFHFTPTQKCLWRYTGFKLSVRLPVRLFARLSVRLSVCNWQCLQSVPRVFFEISILNVVCMLFAAMGRSLMVFSNITFME